MYVPFSEILMSARVWVYQAHRNLTEQEEAQIRQFLPNAIEEWTAHGATLQATFEILYHRFVIIALDEQVYAASGCSIDASTRWFKKLGEVLSVDFFDRSQVFLSGNELKTCSPFQLKKAVNEGLIQAETPIFSIQVSTLEEIKLRWPRPAKETTLKRFLYESCHLFRWRM